MLRYTYIDGQIAICPVPDDYVAGINEFLFTNYASLEQINEAFPDYAASTAVENFTLAVQCALAAGDITMRRITEGVIIGDTTFDAKDVKDYAKYQRTLRRLLKMTLDGNNLPEIPSPPPYPAGTEGKG